MYDYFDSDRTNYRTLKNKTTEFDKWLKKLKDLKAKAIEMTKIAEETGMSRPSLYKALCFNISFLGNSR